MSWQVEYETKCDAYELNIDGITGKKKWSKRGINGDLILYSNIDNLNEIKVRFELFSIQIWWKVFNPKLKKKGSKTRVVTLKRLSTTEQTKETIALRFRDPQICQSFIAKWESLTRDLNYESTDAEEDGGEPNTRERYMDNNDDVKQEAIAIATKRSLESFIQIADKSSFRDVIKLNRMPSLDLIDSDAILREYYFNYGIRDEIQIKNNQINYANYSYGKFNEKEHYLALWMNSQVMRRVFANQLKRPKLNIAIVLDKSESMKESLTTNEVSRMEIAQEALSQLIRHSLDKHDRFSIVTFNEEATVEYPMTLVDSLPYGMVNIRREIQKFKPCGTTDLEGAYKTALALFSDKDSDDASEYYNRIFFLTDLQLDGTKRTEYNAKDGLFGMIKDAAQSRRIHTTFISMGVALDKELFDSSLYGVQGCNYLSVHSKSEFLSKFDKKQEFPYMISPILYDLNVRLNAKIRNVYTNTIDIGDIGKGELLKIQSVFGNLNYSSPLIIKFEYEKQLKLSIGFINKNGERNASEQAIHLTDDSEKHIPDHYYQSVGIRKVVLLCRYIDILRQWIEVDGKSVEKDANPKLIVSAQSKKAFAQFVQYFEGEMREINDKTLQKELDIITKLAVYQDTIDID